MIFYNGNMWHLCAEKVRYSQHSEEITQYVGSEGKEWWLDFAEKWEHTAILEFIPVEPNVEQLARLEEVNKLGIPEGFNVEAGNYVEFGEYPEGFSHPLRPLQIFKEQQLQDRYLLDLDFRQSLSELGV